LLVVTKTITKHSCNLLERLDVSGTNKNENKAAATQNSPKNRKVPHPSETSIWGTTTPIMPENTERWHHTIDLLIKPQDGGSCKNILIVLLTRVIS
jgi:exopolyphosphatase/pppGpp-phosphohydrolase